MPNFVSAQQQTGQVAPQTRNPQPNTTELFQQREDLQTPSTQEVLGQQKKIKIPEGQPVAPESNSGDNGLGMRVILIIVCALIGLGFLVWFLRSGQQVAKPVESAVAKPPPVVASSTPLEQQSSPQPKKKKKKYQGKRKKR